MSTPFSDNSVPGLDATSTVSQSLLSMAIPAYKRKSLMAWLLDSFDAELPTAVHPDADITFFGHQLLDEDEQIKPTWFPADRDLFAPQRGVKFLQGHLASCALSIESRSVRNRWLQGDVYPPEMFFALRSRPTAD